MRIWIQVCTSLLLAGAFVEPADVFPEGIEYLKEWKPAETLAAAKLTAAEKDQIIRQLEQTSFDVPDSWESELRVRRVSLGEAGGLVVRGANLLCGGTGNCETWVFRRVDEKWLNMFEREAPIVSVIGFDRAAASGIKNLLVSANSSAAKESWILWKFDGKFYRASACYDGSLNGDGSGKKKIEKVACK